jgi:hypothetical protein
VPVRDKIQGQFMPVIVAVRSVAVTIQIMYIVVSLHAAGINNEASTIQLCFSPDFMHTTFRDTSIDDI